LINPTIAGIMVFMCRTKEHHPTRIPVIFLVMSLLVFPACQPSAAPLPPTATPSASPAALPQPTLTPTHPLPDVQAGENLTINPLTGLPPDSPENLERRPILVKVENLPRDSRPQWGLSLADIVFEYHTEEGTTRFAAIYYGSNAEKVGPVRSARLFDIQLVQMFKAIFVYGSAYQFVLEKIGETDFVDRLVVEGPYTASALQRYEPEGHNFLLLNTYHMVDVIDFYGMDNERQDLSGMVFSIEPPPGGEAAGQVFVRFSGAIYNRWDYDPASGLYLRYSDVQDDINRTHEVYEPLTDRLTGETIGIENLVILLAENYVVQPNIYDVVLEGEGAAYLARDGSIHPVLWRKDSPDDLLTLWNEAGEPVAFKPGRTWFEVLSLPPDVQQEGDTWRFVFTMPEE